MSAGRDGRAAAGRVLWAVVIGAWPCTVALRAVLHPAFGGLLSWAGSAADAGCGLRLLAGRADLARRVAEHEEALRAVESALRTAFRYAGLPAPAGLRHLRGVPGADLDAEEGAMPGGRHRRAGRA